MIKKIIFSLMLCLMLCSQTFAQEVETGIAFVAWNFETANKVGCDGMVAFAKEQGRTQTNDNFQIPFTDQGNGSYIISMPNGVVFKDGDTFCLRDNKDRWVKATSEQCGLYAGQSNTFTHSNNASDLIVIAKDENNDASSFTAYAIELSKPDVDTYTITFHTTRVASVSPYWLDVWDLAENQKWDTAGGLYEPMKRANGVHELDSKYYADLVEGNNTIHYMAFYGPVEGTHHIEGSELYEIDFTSNGHTDGLLIKAPTKAEMDADNYDAAANGLNGTPLHLRSGIRFGVLNTNYATGTNINDPLRYVKWGHCFRLNEESRALNAFVTKYDPNVEAGRYQFADEAGPCLWNGNNPNSEVNPLSPVANDVNYAKGVPTAGFEKYNKYGDNRLLAEHDIYLKKMYLEVVKEEVNDKVFEKFYLRFEGSYDLQGAAGSVPHNHFVASDLKNEYSKTPNIFIGSDIYLDNRAFQRFYNLNATDAATLKDELGFESVDSYNTLMEGWYKGLSFSDSYKVVSNYVILGKNKVDVVLDQTQEYTAEGGKYTDNAGNEIGTYQSLNYDKGTTTLVQGYDRSYVFSPNTDDAPMYLSVTTKYEFPNAYISPEYVTEGTVQTSFGLTGSVVVNAEPSYTTNNYDLFVSKVNWTESESTLPKHTYRKVNENRQTVEVTENYPVTSWMVKNGECAAIDGCTPTLVAIDYDASNGELGYGEELLSFGPTTPLEQNETRYVHYDVTAAYTFAYVEGLHDASELYAATAAEGDEEVVSPFAQKYEDENTTYTFGNLKYRLAQQTISGSDHSEFTRSTTVGIDGISADENVPAEYYNLQGIKVANPEEGQIYIVRRGAKISKEIF